MEAPTDAYISHDTAYRKRAGIYSEHDFFVIPWYWLSPIHQVNYSDKR